jgi:hypothetical protein
MAPPCLKRLRRETSGAAQLVAAPDRRSLRSPTVGELQESLGRGSPWSRIRFTHEVEAFRLSGDRAGKRRTRDNVAKSGRLARIWRSKCSVPRIRTRLLVLSERGIRGHDGGRAGKLVTERYDPTDAEPWNHDLHWITRTTGGTYYFSSEPIPTTFPPHHTPTPSTWLSHFATPKSDDGPV